MRRKYGILLGLLPVLALGCGQGSPDAQGPEQAPPPRASRAIPTEGPVELKKVTYEELDAAVKQNVGNVVVVDVWATFCAPCKKKFPHMVGLHKKHAKDGLTFISVSIDLPEDEEAALAFLKEKEATNLNLLLVDTDANMEKWEEQYPVEMIPVLLVFDRSGKEILRDYGKIPEAELDQLIEKALAVKS